MNVVLGIGILIGTPLLFVAIIRITSWLIYRRR